jgi:hypothetical protein
MSFEEGKDLGPITVTIKSAAVESVGQGDKAEDKPVLTFVETRKKLVLNKTRLGQLAEVVGSTTDPVGAKIVVSPGQAKVNGRTFDMLVIDPVE